MASTSEIAKRYFDAISAHDLDAAVACWTPGGVDRFVGQQELIAPEGVRAYFSELFDAFPDFGFEILDLTTYRQRTAVRWRARATFAGPGTFQGFEPNGASIDIEGCDVLTVADEKIAHNDAYIDSGDIARQLGFLPAVGSPAQLRLAKLANVRTKLRQWIHGAEPESIAQGVWVVRGGFPVKSMNVYLIEDEGGVTMFDAGISDMTAALLSIGARLGGIRRVVLGHADADHRGAAPGLHAPVYCHPGERAAAESAESFRPYWDFTKLNAPARKLYPKLLRTWDGGAVKIADTVQEGQEIAGFRVVDLPGHAPGLIGLFRESDRLALVSDCFYTVDPQTGMKNAAHVPHPAFNIDTEQARTSIRKLMALDPAAAWAGHADPVTGDVRSQLEQAASAPL
jgi:hydroxyacylglutathione hydrolase